MHRLGSGVLRHAAIGLVPPVPAMPCRRRRPSRPASPELLYGSSHEPAPPPQERAWILLVAAVYIELPVEERAGKAEARWPLPLRVVFITGSAVALWALIIAALRWLIG